MALYPQPWRDMMVAAVTACQQHGVPFDPQPTLLERYESGRKVWGAYDEYPAPLVPKSRASSAPVAG